MGKIIGYKHGEGSVAKVDPRLWDIVQHAIAAQPYDAVIRSGAESRGKSDKGNHMEGHAVDVTLYDKNGKRIPDKGPDGFNAYEPYAQAARVYQKQAYPALDRDFRWGAGFSDTTMDLMHLDITPAKHGGMAYYNWDSGLTDAGRKAFPQVQSNGGLGGPEGARRASAIQQSLATGVPTPPANVPDGAPQPMPSRPAALSRSDAPVPMPGRPTALGSAAGPSLGNRLPQDATYGIQDRLNPGQKAQLPTDFQTLFAHGAPVDARTMSLAAPIRSLGAAGNVGNGATADGSPTIVPGRSLGQPGAIKTTTAPAATVQMSASRPASVQTAPSQLQLLNNGNSPLNDIHDSRDAAVVAAQNATKPSLTVPKATYTPSANNNVGSAPAPHQQGLFQSLGGAIGSGMTALGNSANDAAKYLGKGVRDTVAAIPEKAQEAADYLAPLVLGNLEARSAFLDPMIARLGSPSAGDHRPTRYGATFQDRQQAAQDRERLSQGLPPQQRQTQPQPQQQRQQAPTITTTFRSTAPAPKASPAPANNNGAGGGGNGGGQTITGSATGRTYTVGKTYQDGSGKQFVAQSDGTFKKVG